MSLRQRLERLERQRPAPSDWVQQFWDFLFDDELPPGIHPEARALLEEMRPKPKPTDARAKSA